MRWSMGRHGNRSKPHLRWCMVIENMHTTDSPSCWEQWQLLTRGCIMRLSLLGIKLETTKVQRSEYLVVHIRILSKP
jgi:hypothetical protein